MATVTRSKRAYRKQLDAAILGALSGPPLNVRELAQALGEAGLTWKQSANLYRTLARMIAEGVVVRHSRRECEPVTFSRCGPTQAPATVETPPAPAAVEALVLRVLGRAEKPLSDQQTAWRCSVYQETTRTAAAAALARLAAEGRVVECAGGTFADSRRECDRWRP